MDYQSSHYFGAQYQQQQQQQQPRALPAALSLAPNMPSTPKQLPLPVFSTGTSMSERFEEQRRREQKAAEVETARSHQLQQPQQHHQQQHHQQQPTMRMDAMMMDQDPFYGGGVSEDPRSRGYMATSAPAVTGRLRQPQPPPHASMQMYSSMYHHQQQQARPMTMPMEVQMKPQLVRRQLQPMVDIGDELNGMERSRLPVHYRLGYTGGGVGGVGGGMAKPKRLPSGVLVGPRPVSGIRKAATAERNRYNQLGFAAPGGSKLSVHQRLGVPRPAPRGNLASRLGKKITTNNSQARVRRNTIDSPKKGNFNKNKGFSNTVDPPPSKDDLDNELESYMAKSKNYLDRQLDSYMKEANSLGVKKGAEASEQKEQPQDMHC